MQEQVSFEAASASKRDNHIESKQMEEEKEDKPNGK